MLFLLPEKPLSFFAWWKPAQASHSLKSLWHAQRELITLSLESAPSYTYPCRLLHAEDWIASFVYMSILLTLPPKYFSILSSHHPSHESYPRYYGQYSKPADQSEQTLALYNQDYSTGWIWTLPPYPTGTVLGKATVTSAQPLVSLPKCLLASGFIPFNPLFTLWPVRSFYNASLWLVL